METENSHHQGSHTTRQCQMCSVTPGLTNTQDYMMERLVRWYVKQSEQVLIAFVWARKRNRHHDDAFEEKRKVVEHLGFATKTCWRNYDESND